MYPYRRTRTVEYHSAMLADRPRIAAYLEALRRTVKPGDVVVDLGTGTGILALLAARLGARKVYAIELGDIIDTARELCRANQLESVVEFIPSLSFATGLPERADVLVTETLGDFGIDEGLLGAVIDGRDRFLKARGAILPARLELHVAPVEAPAAFAPVSTFGEDLFGLDLTAARERAASTLFQTRIPESALLATGERIGLIDLRTAPTAAFRGRANFNVVREGALHGLCGWFSAEITDGITIANPPWVTDTHWRQVFLPIDPPLPVAEGEWIHAEVTAAENGERWTWSVERPSPEGAAVRSGRTLSIAPRR